MCLLLVTPVKDSLDTFEITARSVVSSELNCEWEYIVYDDYSEDENSRRLDVMSKEFGFTLVHLRDVVDSPSPNYMYVLQETQRIAKDRGAHIVIVESDVVVEKDTISKMLGDCESGVGMIAAVTVDDKGKVNFPYLYAQHYGLDKVDTRKRLSFCCTMLSNELLESYDFMALDATKAWYDVTISHNSLKLGKRNILDMNNKVRHRPHSSRPWKMLKYSNPLKYYWRKFVGGLDKI